MTLTKDEGVSWSFPDLSTWALCMQKPSVCSGVPKGDAVFLPNVAHIMPFGKGALDWGWHDMMLYDIQATHHT